MQTGVDGISPGPPRPVRVVRNNEGDRVEFSADTLAPKSNRPAAGRVPTPPRGEEPGYALDLFA